MRFREGLPTAWYERIEDRSRPYVWMVRVPFWAGLTARADGFARLVVLQVKA